MVRLFAVLYALLKEMKNAVITQDFKLEGYDYVLYIPFTKFDIWSNGKRPIIRYRGKLWEYNRNQFSLERHGMSWEDTQKPENSHLFVVRHYIYDGIRI